MRALREQLVARGPALDVGAGEARHEAVGQVLQGADAGALRGEAPGPRVLERLLPVDRHVVGGELRRRARQPVDLVAPGRLQPRARLQLQLLEQVDRVRAGFRLRQERFELRVDHAPIRLEAERARELAELGEDRDVLELQAALGLAVLEDRLDALDPVVADPDLVVAVDRVARPVADHLEGSVERAVLAPRQDAVLVGGQAGPVLLGNAAGDRVDRVVVAEGDAHEPAVADRRDADRAALRLVVGIALDPAGDRVAVVRGLEAVGMDRDAVAAGIHRGGTEPAVIHAGEAAGDLALHPVRRDEGRHPVVVGRDDAADGPRAVAQGRGAADHLDPVGDQRVDGHGVVLAEVGHAAVDDAVLLDPHPGIVEAADDRPGRRPRRVGRARDARPVEQGVAQGPGLIARDLILGHHRHR